MLIKSIQRPSKKPCCSGCREGKPCCGSQPRYAKRGGLWLPDGSGPKFAREQTFRRRMSRLDLPQWPRDRKFLLQVERMMPIRFARMKYGDPVRWRRQLQTVKNLLTLPPDQWDIGGLRGLPAFMPAYQYDMTCTGCCDGCCCDIPTTLCVEITVPIGSPCESCSAVATDPLVVTAQGSVDCPLPSGSWLYVGEDSGGCGSPVFDFFFCGICQLELECTDSGETVSLTEQNTEAAAGCVSCGGSATDLVVDSCHPFAASGTWHQTLSDLSCICAGCDSLEEPAAGEDWTVAVNECA